MTEKQPDSFWSTVSIRLGDLHYDGPQPINEHLVQLLGDTMTGKRAPRIRRVLVGALVTRDEDVVDDALAMMIANPPPAPANPLPVVEISMGRYWAFDDTHSVRAWQKTNPNLTVAVDVLDTLKSSAQS